MADVVKYGIQIPNRVFVGGVAFDTKEEELKEFFAKYGKIKECKIIKDNQSISRGFAFVTFECKHDAIQTQQLGTVFFKQKKLNLGPAIRQKGVVFNGTKEAENEPVLSTGVYIHPSGYSYTVAPNGVWYFHNPDGTPPTNTPGSPPMAYTSNIVQKTQLHARRSSTGSSTCGSVSPTSVIEGSPSMNVPVYSSAANEMTTMPPSQFIHTSLPYQPGMYIHHGHHLPNNGLYGNPNIHVAFQNMSISSHMGHSTQHVTPQFHVNSHPQVHQPSNRLPPTMNASTPPHPMQYTRMTEMYIPYYPDNPKYSVPSCINAVPQIPEKLPNHCQYQLNKPDCLPMLPNGFVGHMKDAYVYPYGIDPLRPHYVYMPHESVVNDSRHGQHKRGPTKHLSQYEPMETPPCFKDGQRSSS